MFIRIILQSSQIYNYRQACYFETGSTTWQECTALLPFLPEKGKRRSLGACRNPCSLRETKQQEFFLPPDFVYTNIVVEWFAILSISKVCDSNLLARRPDALTEVFLVFSVPTAKYYLELGICRTLSNSLFITHPSIWCSSSELLKASLNKPRIN